ncbi:MAG TPA: hypothetical protein VHU91_00975 [Mycobacteriales bacterium]|jgi:hypothetical protein|nr:hypothetical protein [Mycobacteriales bacterium]
MVVSPGGRFDRRRAHALVCDSRRNDAVAGLAGVVSAEPPAWDDGLALTSSGLQQPVFGAASPALPSSFPALAVRRSRTRGGGPRSLGVLRTHSVGAGVTTWELAAEAIGV